MRILLAGDVMLGRLVNEALERRPPEFPWGDTLDIFRSADLRICNLECAVSDRGRPWSATPKAFHFRTDSKNVKALNSARIDAVTLANNHILDFEYDALADTLENLDRAGIRHAGAGLRLREAMAPAIMNVKGLKACLIAFTDNEPGWEAKDDHGGVFYAPIDAEDARAKRLLDTVKEARQKASVLIVSAHWGPNWGYRPVPEHIPFAHALIDAGADIVFGHSCHVFQGVEIYRNKPIIYSAGNFIDDYAVDDVERNDESFLFIVETDGLGVDRLLLRPIIIDNFQARLAPPMRAELIAAKMKTLCAEFDTKTRWIEDQMSLEIAFERKRAVQGG